MELLLKSVGDVADDQMASNIGEVVIQASLDFLG
jgi:hypothetical protein